MIRLCLQGGVLRLESGGDAKILEWQHRLFFAGAAGYRFHEARGWYLFSKQDEIHGILKETIDYLEDEGFEFEMDEAVATLLQRLHDEQQEYEEALHAGREIQQSELAVDSFLGLVRQLKSHQLRGIQHLLAMKHGASFSVPGSGKTTVIYAVYELLRREGIVQKLLVIGPRSCFLPWEEEFVACFGCRAHSARLTGSKESRYSLLLEADKYDVFLCTYQTATNDVNELIRLCTRYKVFAVVDESHRIKKLEGGVWSEAMLQIAPYAARRAILSGTPMPNSYLDLWTQITFLWPGRQVLGDPVAYRHQCENETEHTAVRKAIRPFFVRATKSELDLPPFEVKRIECDLKRYQEGIYRALSVKYLRQIDTPPEDRQVLRQWRKARMVRLIQAASNPALLTHYSEEFDIPPLSGEGASVIQLIDEYPKYEIPAKIELVDKLVRELLKQEEKVVVWTSFVHNIRMLEQLLKEFKPFIVYGAVPQDESEDVEFNREQQIRQFKASDRASVLLANPAACSESISLHKACRHAIYLDRTFNCGQYMQSLDRIHRVGLAPDDIVTYHILIAKGTIDETIDHRLEEKQARMIRLLEDEFPRGTLEVDLHQMGQSESEEAVDFERTMTDLKGQIESSDTTKMTP